jgi:hypothetical protein
MESILVWILVIAAIAILLMLALLISSERELKRARAELLTTRPKSESAAAAVPPAARPDMQDTKDQQLAANVAALTLQLQSKEAAMARMRGEIEALRAENNSLQLETTPRHAQRPGQEARAVANAPSRQVAKPIIRTTIYRSGAFRHQSWPAYGAGAAVLLLAAGGAIYLKDARQYKSLGAARVATPPAAPPGADDAEPERADVAAAATEKTTETRIAPRPGADTQSAKTAGVNYEVVRSTRIFSQPNDASQPLARVEAGMEINVVGVQEDWLEVRSRHGRPSGFIKSDAAVIKQLH